MMILEGCGSRCSIF